MSDQMFWNFASGLPAPGVFPKELLSVSTTELLDNQMNFNYGTYGAPQGVIESRNQIAEYLSNEFNDVITGDQIALTCGVSGAVDLGLQIFSSPGDEIIVEDPTFYEVKSFVSQYNLTVVPIPTTDEGFNVDELERRLESKEISPKLMYIIPDFSNPRGITLNEEKRKKLVKLAYKYEFMILSDEVYQLLYFGDHAKTPKPMALYDLDEFHKSDSKGGVVSIGSVSKTIMPSLRLGWLFTRNSILLRKFYDRAVELSGGLHSFYSAGIFEAAIRNGMFDKRLSYLRNLYLERSSAMVSALDSMITSLVNQEPKFEDKFRYHKPSGGFFIWMELPEWLNLNTPEAIESAKLNYSISYLAGTRASFISSYGNHCIRLCFVLYDPPVIQEGISRLGEHILNEHKKISQ